MPPSSQLCRLVLKWRTRCNFLCIIGLTQADRVRKLIFQVAIYFFFLYQSVNKYLLSIIYELLIEKEGE